MRVTQERNVVVVAIILACALATAAWLTSVTGHAKLSQPKGESGRAVESPLLSPPTWEPVVLTAAQVEIKTWVFEGTTYAYLKFLFPNAGYRVATFDSPTRIGNDFTGGASVEKFGGDSVQAVTTTAGIYDLGAITPGSYNFTFQTSGITVKSLPFTVAAPPFAANSIDNARAFVKEQYRDFLNREPDQAGGVASVSEGFMH